MSILLSLRPISCAAAFPTIPTQTGLSRYTAQLYAPPPTHPTVVFSHRRLHTLSWCSCTIVHPPSRGFLAPSSTRPAVVFSHHRPPAAVLLHYRPPTLKRCSCTIAHPLSHGFLAPSSTRPAVVFLHHRLPTAVLLHHRLPTQKQCYYITHLPSSGFPTPLSTRPAVVFSHHRPPTPLWFSCTIAHLPRPTRLTAVPLYPLCIWQDTIITGSHRLGSAHAIPL